MQTTYLFPKALGAALLKVQGDLRGVGKDGSNPHFKSKYATLENVVETIRPVLQSHGIVFLQAPGLVNEAGVLSLTTILAHPASGESYETVIGVPLVKKDPQGVGSAITYACRYSLMALLGLPPIDDDGEGAMTRPIASKSLSRDVYKAMEGEIRGAKTRDELKVWMKTNKSRIEQMPEDWQNDLRVECGDALAALESA